MAANGTNEVGEERGINVGYGRAMRSALGSAVRACPRAAGTSPHAEVSPCTA